MKTSSPNGIRFRNKEHTFPAKLDEKSINKIARSTGFSQRKSAKITPIHLILGFFRMTVKKLSTYEDWGSEIGILSKKSLSKQAVEERMTPAAAEMIKQVFEAKLGSVLAEKSKVNNSELGRKFKEIKIDDSTILGLPEELSQFFPGNVSRGKKKAQIKIHALYNFTGNTFSFLNVHSYTDSDQGLAGNAIPHLNQGDLILRDLGFQNLILQKELIEKGIYFVSKKRPGIKVYDINTEHEVDLIKLVRKKRWVDQEILVGTKEKIPMRLVIQPVSDEIAAERRRKAKKDRDQRLNHSKDFYELLGYSILLTNIPTQKCTSQEIGQLYGLRWRIEIIFKSWKTHFSIERSLPERCNNIYRIRCIIYLSLLLIVLFQAFWSKDTMVGLNKNLSLSLLKLSKFFRQHFIAIYEMPSSRIILQQLMRQCVYEKRTDRENMMEKYYKMAA